MTVRITHIGRWQVGSLVPTVVIMGIIQDWIPLREPLAIGLTHRLAVMEMTSIRELLLCIIKSPIRPGHIPPVVPMHSPCVV